MSLAIDIDRVTAVLLHDGWHDVLKNPDGVSSFEIDAYEYLGDIENRESRGKDAIPRLLGGQCAGVPSLGFVFKAKAGWTAGPLTGIYAVRYSARNSRGAASRG